MFKKFLLYVRSLLRNAFLSSTPQDETVPISSRMECAIELWARMYDTGGPWISEKDGLRSLGLPATIASEFARLTVAEAQFHFTGGARAAAMEQWTAPLLANLRAYVEYGCALGCVVFKPYNLQDRIVFSVTAADNFIPISYDSALNLTGAVFMEQLRRGRRIYTRLEKHECTPGGYTVQNRAYSSANDAQLGQPIPLSDVPEWADLAQEVVFEGVGKPLFGCFRIPFANQEDRGSPLGVSVYSRAASLIRDADEQYGRLLWEYEGGELAVDAASDYLEVKEGGAPALPKRKRRLFRSLNSREPNFYSVFAPQLRDESFRKGLDEILRRIELNCGLAYGTLSNPDTVEKTAEEIRASKQRSYIATADLQRALETALTDAVDAANRLADIYGLTPGGDCALSCQWGDSVLEDSDREFQRRKELADSGYIRPEMLTSWYFGVEEDEARAMLAEKGVETDPFGFGGNV